MKKLFVSCMLLPAVLAVKAQSVDEIASKHIEALGGKANLEKVKNVVMEGSMEVMNNKLDVKIVRVPGKLFRQDITMGDKTGYTLVTDTSGWIFMPFIGQTAPEPLPAEALKSSKGELDVADGLVNYQAKGNTIQLKGKEDVAGSDCYKLEVVSGTGDTSTMYLDAKTYLITRIATAKELMGQKMDINIDFSDYKEVDGVKFPFTMGTLQGPITFSSIKTNQTIDSASYSH